MHSTQAAELEFGGLVEAELFVGDEFTGADYSDIVLATIELGVDARLNDRVSAHLLMLHEDDDTEPMEVDEGFISVRLDHGLSVSAGRMYVPFGSFESHFITDPLTIELGETREAAAVLSYVGDNGLYGAVYAFNGDTIEAGNNGDETIDGVGGSIGYLWEDGDMSLDVGLDYISNIADGDTTSDTLSGGTYPHTLQEYVNAMALHANYTRGPLAVFFEYMASDQYNVADLGFNGRGAEPTAVNLEAGYDFGWSTAMIGYQGTDEAVNLELPEHLILVGLSKEIYENTYLSAEYGMYEDYSSAAGGTGNDKNLLTVQLAVEF
ncbi:hypothetical protein Tel_09600 [Candidatus Tenderia electrophaga]|jgi:hypothetical protein|uniref:LbtU family siderophore porin n=1 Tax=Candidatus Tenderia electrophaga TaxID=1748243 RepID=A0A0S2TE07_9GAMM|nr:hypothetical protein Tel_09600 [Candidatus Tenderia electrophaga]